MNDNTLRIDGSQPGDSLRLMRTPDAWPHGGFLTLTRGGFHGDMGVLINRPGVPLATVFRLNMMDARLKFLLTDPRKALEELDIPHDDYGSLEEVAADGWTVD